jgi:protein-disulfide isomerase/uncharacterized membrane protein
LGESARKRIAGALVLCIAGAIVSGVLLLQHHGESGAVSAVNQVCGDGQTSGCETVARSSWSKVGGLPLAAVGLFFYGSLVVLLVLVLLSPPDVQAPLAFLALGALGAALVIDVALLGVQALSIHAFCALCLVTYALNAASVALLWPARRVAGAVGGTASAIPGRLVVAGWALASLAVAGGVVAADSALAHREKDRISTLLGGPAPATTPSPAVPAPTPAATATAAAVTPAASTTPAHPAATATPAGGGDMKYYQDLSKRLQETLDDPQKLAEYFTAKAAKEFASAPIQRVDLKDVPFKGPANAPVQVVEYSDFLCPFCRNIAGAFSQFLPQSGNRVVVYFKNYPLDKECNASLGRTVHPGACFLALGGLCANYQGKFPAFHDKVFSTDLRDPKADDVVRLAGEVGLNADAMRSCLVDPKTKEQLAAQIEEAKKVGVQSTPTLLINGKKLPRVEDFISVVDKEAQAKGFPPMTPPKVQ